MLVQVASAAFKKGAMVELDSLCAMINKLVPPQALRLYELIRKHADTCGAARVEVIVRELIPPLIALPAGLEKFVLIAAASAFKNDLNAKAGEGWEPSVHWVVGDISDLIKAGSNVDRQLAPELLLEFLTPWQVAKLKSLPQIGELTNLTKLSLGTIISPFVFMPA